MFNGFKAAIDAWLGPDEDPPEQHVEACEIVALEIEEELEASSLVALDDAKGKKFIEDVDLVHKLVKFTQVVPKEVPPRHITRIYTVRRYARQKWSRNCYSWEWPKRLVPKWITEPAPSKVRSRNIVEAIIGAICEGLIQSIVKLYWTILMVVTLGFCGLIPLGFLVLFLVGFTADVFSVLGVGFSLAAAFSGLWCLKQYKNMKGIDENPFEQLEQLEQIEHVFNPEDSQEVVKRSQINLGLYEPFDGVHLIPVAKCSQITSNSTFQSTYVLKQFFVLDEILNNPEKVRIAMLLHDGLSSRTHLTKQAVEQLHKLSTEAATEQFDWVFIPCLCCPTYKENFLQHILTLSNLLSIVTFATVLLSASPPSLQDVVYNELATNPNVSLCDKKVDELRSRLLPESMLLDCLIVNAATKQDAKALQALTKIAALSKPPETDDELNE